MGLEDVHDDEVCVSGKLIDRIDVMDWFKAVNFEQARDTFRVVEGILEMRKEAQPKRKRRKDAGMTREQMQVGQIKLTEGK